MVASDRPRANSNRSLERLFTAMEAGSRGDHRVAMALAVAGLAAEGETPIDGWEAVGVSYPRFLEDLNEIAQR